MGRYMKATKAKSQSWRDGDEIAAEKNERAPISVGKPPRCDDHRATASPHLSIIPKADSADLRGSSIKKPAQARKLSTRAENVLKILAVELTREDPPRGRWVPSELLLQRLSYKHLAAARNCGPQTTAEIIEWALGRGTISDVRSPPENRSPPCGSTSLQNVRLARSQRPRSPRRSRPRRDAGTREFPWRCRRYCCNSSGHQTNDLRESPRRREVSARHRRSVLSFQPVGRRQFRF